MKTIVDKIVRVLLKQVWILPCITMLLGHLNLSAQVNIIIPTGAFQYSLQDLGQTQIDNVSGSKIFNCYAEIICTDGIGNRVFEMRTPNTTLVPGNNLLGYTSITSAQITGSGQSFTTLQQTGIFPPGNYTICLTEYSNGGSRVLGTSCSSVATSDFGNVYLLSPQDEAIIETLYPTLDWMTYNTRKLHAVITYTLRVCLLQPARPMLKL